MDMNGGHWGSGQGDRNTTQPSTSGKRKYGEGVISLFQMGCNAFREVLTEQRLWA